MRLATLAIIIEDGKMLLGEKQKGEIGTGKLSGPGGKIDPGETLEECLIRETREELEIEIELEPVPLRPVAIIDFCVRGEIDFRTFVYFAKIVSGEIHETADMIPAWYPVGDLPFERMYDGDPHWLPRVIAGERFGGRIHYKKRARGFQRFEFVGHLP